MKINGTTVRGGWSSKFVYGNVSGRRFQLSAQDSFVTSISKIKYLAKKIESGKVQLPEGFNLFTVSPKGELVGFK